MLGGPHTTFKVHSARQSNPENPERLALARHPYATFKVCAQMPRGLMAHSPQRDIVGSKRQRQTLPHQVGRAG